MSQTAAAEAHEASCAFVVHPYDIAGMPTLHRSAYRVPMDSKQRNQATAQLEARLGPPLTVREQKLLLLAETLIEKNTHDDSRAALTIKTSD